MSTRPTSLRIEAATLSSYRIFHRYCILADAPKPTALERRVLDGPSLPGNGQGRLAAARAAAAPSWRAQLARRGWLT